MAFDRNSFYKSVDGEAQQPEQPQQAQPQEAENGVLNTPILDSVNNFFSVDAETRQNLYNDAMEDAQHIDINPEAFEENPGIDENVVANYEARRKNIVQAINNAAEEDGFFADKAQSVRASGVYRNYLLNDEERLAQARDIEATTGIQADAILNDDAAFRNAQHVADYVKKQQAAVGPGQVFSLQNIYKMYPELAGLADMDEVQTAQALHDIDNIKRTGDAIQDVKNVMGAMWDEGKKKLRHDKLWYKVYQGKATEEEREEAEKLYKELNTPGEAPRMPDFLEHPVEYAMGGLAQSMPEMLEGYKGNMVGGIAGAVVGTGAAIIAAMAVGSTGVGIPAIPAAALFGWKIGSNITGTMSLAEPETGARYAEMSHRTDAKGNRLYTDNELKYVAPAGGLFNAAIENYTNLYLAKKLLPSKSLERAAFESTVRVATEQIAAAQSTRVAANQFAKERIKDIAEGTFAESFEEALQTTSDDMVDNWLVASTGKGKAHSMQDIAKDAFNSFMDALPTSFAFGMAGGAGGTFTGTIGLAEHFNNIAERNQQYNQQAQHTMLGINLVGRLQDAVNASKLKDSNAQLQRKIMHNQLEGSGFEMVYIDTNSLLQREGGREQLDKVAKAAEYDAAAVDAAVKEGTMTVNMETFAQAGTDSTILNDISFDANEPSMEAMMQNARDAIASHEEIAKQAIEEFNKTKDIIIEHYFADDKEAAEQAIIAMYSNPQNPAAGIRKIEKELKAAKQEILAPALDRLQQGMGNGVEIVQNDDGSGVRVSNNEAWYQKFYAARGRAPYKWELEQMAADMLTGEASAPEVEGWRITTQEEYDSAAEIRKKLKDIDNELKVIDRVKEKMADLSSSEMQQIIGLTPEAFSVYRTFAEQLKSAPGTAARAARLNAILFARHADRFAQIMTEKSGMKYTALDYYNRVKVAFDGEQPGDFAQMAGVNAANAPLAMLEKAKAMQEEGKDTKEIWKYTGWMKGQDGKWRFEIKDDLRDINEYKLQELADNPGIGFNLSDIYYNQDLFEAYPWLNEVLVVQTENMGTAKGAAGKGKAEGKDGEINLIGLSADTVQKIISNNLEAKSILIHEIQHLIQEYENFARGGSVANAHEQISQEISRVVEQFNNLSFDEKEYYHSVEQINDYLFNDGAELSEEQEKALNDKEEELSKKFTKKQIDNIYDIYYRLYELQHAQAKLSNREIYENLAGEQEAREAQERAIKNTKQENAAQNYDSKMYKIEQAISELPEYEKAFDLLNTLEKESLSIRYKRLQQKLIQEVTKDSLDRMKKRVEDANTPDIIKKFAAERIPKLEAELQETENQLAELAPAEEYQKATEELFKLPKEQRQNVQEFLDIQLEKYIQTDALSVQNEIPNIHNSNAIVVFGGKEFSAESMEQPTTDENGFSKAINPSVREQMQAIKQQYINDDGSMKPGYMKAPNGKDTKLNEEQWLIVRTDEFKNWFGDWENLAKRNALQNNSPIQIANDLYELEGEALSKAAKEYYSNHYKDKSGRPIILSTSDGRELTLGTKGFKEINRHSSNFELNLKMVPNIPEIIDKGIYLFSSPVQKSNGHKRDNTKAFHYYGAKLKAGNEEYFVRFVVREYYDFSLYYDHDLTTVEEIKRGPRLRTNSDTQTDSGVENLFDNSIPSWWHSVNEDNVSKVVDENGEPKVMYHQTANVFDTYDVHRENGGGIHDYMTAFGVFTKPTQNDIGLGNIQMPLFVSVKNPISFNNRPQIEKWAKENVPGFAEMLSERHKIDAEYQKKVDEAAEKGMEEYTNLYEQHKAGKISQEEYEKAVDESSAKEEAVIKEWKQAIDKQSTEMKKVFDGYVRSLGYDGMYLQRDEGAFGRYVETTIAFEGKQIKSATDNNGNFDAKDNNIYHQDIKGATSNLPNGNKLIQLFETADESTFLHEMGHLFLLDLEDLARIDEVSANELATIRGWAEWEKGDYKKYKNTPWYKEFADREQAIIDADMNGDVNEAIRLRRVWMQERFARGFELYLREGKAPAKGLRSVFRKFASFLRQVYSAFVSDGSRASAEVEAIMARMIATDKEIEAVAMDDGFKDIEKAGGEKLLMETERETYERWLNEAKEEAREKLHKEVFKDLMQRDKDLFEEHLKIVEEKKRAELEQEPIYLAREIVKSMGGDKRGALNVFDSIEQYEAADKAAPELEKALQDYLNEWRKEYEAEEISMKVTEEAVREAMESSAYHQRAKALEAAAMARKLDLKRKINSKAEQALQGVQDALDAMPEQMDLKADKTEAPVRAVMAKINSLRFSTKWSAKDFAQIERMIKAASREELQQEIKKFKDEMKQQKLNVQAVEEANKGRLKLYADIAKQQIAQQPIFNATNVNEHKRKQRKAEANVLAMVKAGQFQLAIQQQQSAALSAALAKEATKAKEEVDKMVAAINKQLTARSVKLPAKERYWHRWLCYNLRLGEIAEPEKPVLKNGQQLGTLQELLEGYKDRLDLLRDYDATGILDIINANQQTGYKSMTIADFQKVKDLLDIIYKCGKDEFSLKTISGVTIDEAVTEIISEASLADKMKVQRRKIQANTGGLGWNDWAAKIPVIGEATAKYGQSYLSIGMKPEKLIELLGTKASKYIYGTLDKAANDEAAAMAKAIQDVQAMLAGFSHADRRAWKDLKYELLLPGEGGEIEKVQCSKENIICMALNLGTEKNRQRLTGGLFGPAPGATEEAQKAAAAGQTNSLITFCQQNMTKEEWQLVQNIWDYIHSYWADTCRVEEELNGQHLMAEAPMPFTVMLPSGENITMQGGYFSVDFNPEKNAKAAQQAQDDVAQQQAGGAKVFGAGRKFVKARSDADVFRELSLRFDTIPTHLQQVIHNITHRLAARDVYRLLNNTNMTRYIEDHLGAPYRDILIQWAKDCWTQLPEKDMAGNFVENAFASLRRNSTFAIMAYRIWPVVENLSNIGPTADRIGAVNALSAVFEFYGHMADFRKLMDKSVLMRNRLNNMDRDIRSQEGLFKADNKVFETLREHGYDAMTYSDLMFSAPLWCRVYKDNYMRCYQEAYADNEANKKRLQEAQDNLDKLRGELLDNKKDINDWHAEKRNRAKAGQVGWQPGTSRFAVMPRSQFDIQLPELESKTDTISKKIWEAEIELGHAAELKIYQGAALVAEAERRAVNAADAAVRDAFGSGRTVDLAAVSRTNSELLKSMSTFYSFFNTQFNAIYFKYLEGKYNSNDAVGTWGKMQAWSPFAKSVINRVIVTALIGSLLKMATKTDGDDDKDKYRKVKNKDGKTVKEEIPWLERFLKVFAKNTLSMSFGAFYGVRDVANLALNLAFDGTDFGRGLNVTSTPLRSIEEGFKTIKLIASKSKRDLEIQEQQEREAAKYKKMSRAQKRKYDEEKKYKQPIRRITYEEIFRHGLNSICGFSAATTGLASTVVDSVTGTMQYLLDTDNRFDATWRNILWSAIFDKKPVERKPEPKPEPKKKKKK